MSSIDSNLPVQSASSAGGGPRFAPDVEAGARQIIVEELGILSSVRAHLESLLPQITRTDYDEEMLELRDAIGEARTEDVPQIIALMESLAVLTTHHEVSSERGVVRRGSPYFGHIRLEQDGRVRDVLIGSTSVLGGNIRYPIVDWRQSPVSKLYYSYREGDGYEEELGGNMVSGEILTHRTLTIRNGELAAIRAAEGEFRCREGEWRPADDAVPALAGGEGRAVRAETVGSLHLGVEATEDGDQGRHLSEITALIDPAQFELITRPDSGIVVIDGGAGSGKTTIALHRIAYLAFRDRERFRPESMLAVVFNKALASYISRLLPALGVKGVRIEVFEELAERLRQRHYPDMPVGYAETTPYSVIRFKQHPAATIRLREAAAAWEADVWREIESAIARTESEDKVRRAWAAVSDLPLALRIERLSRWVAGKLIVPGVGGFGEDWVAQGRLTKVLGEALPNVNAPSSIPQLVWEEALLREEELAATLEREAPGEFSPGQIEEIHQWALRAQMEREDYRTWQEERRSGEPPEEDEYGEPASKPGQPAIDREDDTLLLLIYRELVGPLRSRRQRPYTARHLMIDEAQDFSPLDLDWLIGLAPPPRSVTLAGDTAQRVILHNAFDSWEDVLHSLGLQGTSVSPLAVGYRSTAEIMAFSRHVLGDLQPDREWTAVRSGAPVDLLHFSGPGQAAAMLGDALHELMRREPHAYVAVIARYPEQAQLYYEGLERAEVPRLRRVADQEFAFRPGIEVTDVSQVKGLEFDYVVLVDVDSASYPDDVGSRYLLHIAATRAAHQLWLVTCAPPSPLLPEALRLAED